ncbi:LRR receptor-like serine/threonine-protein kinase FEI 1 isoform X3 [Gossypium australe]|uniref:LRR receptor-like serine/threonine-protein kinase FEI 1 isoform X3 n=1 Tax=Gossypium australe TaxID=47621 RepID=A0A5B6UJZ7_9ROSI|nr:LRR receptor-like serine/threonine-protein kinase FEI 1 isoform X3 [Gossypium australe]
MRVLLSCLFSFIFASTLWSIGSSALSLDGLTLLEIKSTLNDSKNFLGNWQATDENPCNWTGISCYPNDHRVRSMALHQNNLHGQIPNELTNCTELRALHTVKFWKPYFSHHTQWNKCVGKLVFRDLSSNLLKGAIPSSIGHLTRLHYLFIGNLDLCGQQVNKPCRTSLGFPAVLPHAEIPTKRSSHYIKGVMIGAMLTMALVLVMLLAFLWIYLLSKKERAVKRYTEVKKQVNHDTSTKLITFHGDLPYPSCEIIEKLESLDEEDVVGSGGFGTVYRMVMNDCQTFAVKRIDRSREGSDQVFERELEILGSIKHINLVNMRGYCRFPASKLLIYDYLAMGSLDDFLHECKEEGRLLNWSARLKIALGSARGLAYLHHDCCPKLVHRDIKSSNILLDENLEPHVSDFGLAQLLVDEDAHVTTVVAGTFGYLAPEYLQSGIATEKTDVYSFGVLLLELVTGKRPTDPTFSKRGLNVVGWTNTLLRENRLEDIVDKGCTDAIMETVEAILEIAAKCTDANPDERPTMCQVLQLLEQEVMSPYPSDFESHSDYC